MNNCFFSVIKFLDRVDSTNTELLKNEYEDKTLLYSFNQIKGRGRFERNWITFKDKSLALSILLKNNDKINIKNHFFITATLAISLIELLEKNFQINGWIKWPNDVYIKDKKLAGILTETIYLKKNDFKIVTGIGININVNQDDLNIIDKKTTSLLIETNKKIELDKFVKNFTCILSNNFSFLFENDNNKTIIKEKWLKNCPILNKNVTITNKFLDMDNSVIKGTVIDIDNEGFLIIKMNGKIEKIISGDVKIIEN